MDKILSLISQEKKRQSETLMMIPSENYTYPEVHQAVGSCLMHKYSEGYSARRYYQGNKFIDEIENYAIDLAKKALGTPHANVQPYSGSPANAAVYFALAEPGDTIMGMKLNVGGHLTHGHPDITFSGKYFNPVQFEVDKNGQIDYEEIEKVAKKSKPKIMLIGTTAYPLAFKWARFGQIADSVGAWLVADISHVIGLVLAKAYPSPVRYAHVITSTTHKTLRGPRGAIIWVTNKGIAKDSDLSRKIDRGVFPGVQGGPHNNTTAGIAIALKKAQTNEFRNYGKQVVKNAKVLAGELKKAGLSLYANGTECHLLVLDFVSMGLTGNFVAEALEVAGIVVNWNSVPNDPMPPFYPSGVRLGTPGLTARGMKEDEMKQIARWIVQVINHIKDEKMPEDPGQRKAYLQTFKEKTIQDQFLKKINNEVKALCLRFPI